MHQALTFDLHLESFCIWAHSVQLKFDNILMVEWSVDVMGKHSQPKSQYQVIKGQFSVKLKQKDRPAGSALTKPILF